MKEKLKRAAIVGIGTTAKPGNIHPYKTWKDLVADAAYEAIGDAKGLKPRDIDGGVIAYHGEGVNEQGGIGGSVADLLGIAPAPVFPHSMNCSGSAVALNTGWEMIASGKYKRVLVMGFEKEGDNINYTENINISFDTEYDYMFGFRHRDGFELMSNYYMKHYGYEDYTSYAAMSYAAHTYGRMNPKASVYGKPMPEFESLKNANSCFSMMGEGAAAAILVPEEDAYLYTDKPVFIEGISLACTSHYIAHRVGEPPMGPDFPEGLKKEETYGQSVALIAAARDAYDMAGITAKDIDVAQVYDLTAGSFWFLDGLGITKFGEGGRYFIEGKAMLDGGAVPINTDGGNIARGHASGADGLNQVIEDVVQLRGDAGERQVKDAKVGVAACVGSAFAHMTVVVLTNDKFKRKEA
ncbi:thiolase family protein [Clostridium autoethanogenum]|uniref:Thiolase family protein n=1 Tax=Clostridium autoethanogenum DSM 10061 TaxID=1341692 RepID=A0ABM5NZ42_9CLOT|nr:thiolase family protein [Clostridium autoethanogenum]AGY77788.1 thiolase family protein [Clostridium autoethanogenum DSM 10061]ALU37923.1 Thiolase-like enzyme [Clostridium autoethanogenum DSM 10061]OVY49726.1 acetyl-CoA acetyltransferase [Clostridium autoethanogenum]